MEKYTSEKIIVSNPSQLVMRVDEYLKLSKKLPSQNESLQNRERQIFESLASKSLEEYERLLFFPIDLEKVATQVNIKYQDGIYLDEDLDTIKYPYDRTIRTKPKRLEDPTREKVASPKKVPPLKLGNYRILRDNSIAVLRNNATLLALEDTFETSHKKR